MPSPPSEWCATKKGPRRDLIGDLADAVRRRGLVFGASSHRAEHWWFMEGGRAFESDVQDERFRDLYGPAQPKDSKPDGDWLEDWLIRTCELVDRYQPQIMWFDWWIEQPAFIPYLKAFAAYYYNKADQWGKDVAINYKHNAYPPGYAIFDVERGQLAGTRPVLWQTDTAVAKNSWGYTDTMEYKTADTIIGDLVDIVSKNGALLLNIGPRADGTIPSPDQKILRTIGRWLKINGEAIYNTRPWRVFGEGPTSIQEGSFTDTKRDSFTSKDVRFTATDEAVYAIVLVWPEQGTFRIETLKKHAVNAPPTVSDITMLGCDQP